MSLVNSDTAEVAAVRSGTVSFRLEGGRMLDMRDGDPQLRRKRYERHTCSDPAAFRDRFRDPPIEFDTAGT